MDHCQQTINLEADPATVYAALTTPEGLRGWWTPDCDVEPGTGGTIHLQFGRTRKTLRVERLVRDREVRCLCIQAYIAAGQLVRRDGWVGTPYESTAATSAH